MHEQIRSLQNFVKMSSYNVMLLQ